MNGSIDKENEPAEDLYHNLNVFVVGCGGAGCRTVDYLTRQNIQELITIAVDTNQAELEQTSANHRILIGQSITGGKGAGGYPDIGRRAAEESSTIIRPHLIKADIVFLCAGLGGGTGTGAAPVIADIAREQGAFVIGWVFLPFQVERFRLNRAYEGLRELLYRIKSIIILDNNELVHYDPHLPLQDAFAARDHFLVEIIADGIFEAHKRNQFDIIAFRTIFSQPGIAIILVGEIPPQIGVEYLSSQCLCHPSADINFHGATGSYILIFGGADLTLRDADEVATGLTDDLDSHGQIYYCCKIKEGFEEKRRALCTITGIHFEQLFMKRPSPRIVRTFHKPGSLLDLIADDLDADKKRSNDLSISL